MDWSVKISMLCVSARGIYASQLSKSKEMSAGTTASPLLMYVPMTVWEGTLSLGGVRTPNQSKCPSTREVLGCSKAAKWRSCTWKILGKGCKPLVQILITVRFFYKTWYFVPEMTNT